MTNKQERACNLTIARRLMAHVLNELSLAHIASSDQPDLAAAIDGLRTRMLDQNTDLQNIIQFNADKT